MTWVLTAWRWLGPAGRWVVGGALVVFLLVLAFLWWLGARDQRIRDEEAIRCKIAGLNAELEGWAVIREKEKALAELNAELAKQRQAFDQVDIEKTGGVVREIIRVSPSAASCVWDADTARLLNDLGRVRQ